MIKLLTRRVVRFSSWLTPTGGEVRAVVEDDYHHFRIGIRHDGSKITSTFSEGPRPPFSLCEAAGGRLEEMIGMPLNPDPTFAASRINARLQCTHQFDIASMGFAAAVRGIKARRYDVAVTDPENKRRTASLSRDGIPCLTWEMEGGMILNPEPYSGRDIGSGFSAWVAASLSPDDAEAALILRRTAFIASARLPKMTHEQIRRLTPKGGCWVHQPDRFVLATRVSERQDFTNRPQALTSDDEFWLAPD